jgi:glycerol-1-phosphate dehydrogenase [NAD(P)+]
MSRDGLTEAKLLETALQSARDTKQLVLERGALRQSGEAFESLFGSAAALVIADDRTLAAGRDVVDSLRNRGQSTDEPFILDANTLYAEYSHVEAIERRIAATDAVPVAIGAGTINDLVKLAADKCGRPYLIAATAASMDGYTAYGASITFESSKQTFDCAAPRGVIADLDVIAAAPEGLNASGYADLAAKIPAGADWIVADLLGEEPIDRQAWQTVQTRLRYWMADPAGVRARNIESLRRVTVALMMTGFAMQAARTSRCASGAEHQFSHLWDMQHHTHNGQPVSHGFKVGVATVAIARLYEALFDHAVDVERGVAGWRPWNEVEADIHRLFDIPELRDKALEETRAKLISRDDTRRLLEKLRDVMPGLRSRLRDFLPPSAEIVRMLKDVGAPTEPEQIGIARTRMRDSFRLAYYIRRRFTALDVAVLTGLLDTCLAKMYPEAA